MRNTHNCTAQLKTVLRIMCERDAIAMKSDSSDVLYLTAITVYRTCKIDIAKKSQQFLFRDLDTPFALSILIAFFIIIIESVMNIK